eukprot:5305530-Pleurochrysis_carterae.AAC.4
MPLNVPALRAAPVVPAPPWWTQIEHCLKSHSCATFGTIRTSFCAYLQYGDTRSSQDGARARIRSLAEK